MMRCYVEGVGLLGPGLESWAAGREILAGVADYRFAPTILRPCEMLPAAERRRAGIPVKLALAVGQEAFQLAGREAGSASSVFTSSGSDNDNVHAINQILATAPHEMSPTRFHNSVHNAAAGYWCIATGSQAPSTSLCAHDASFAAGMLEAAAQVAVDGIVVALIAYDHAYPYPMSAVRPIAGAMGVALLLTPERTDGSLAALDITLTRGVEETVLQDEALERLRLGIPAARSLPVLRALAQGGEQQVYLASTGAQALAVRVIPC